MIRRAAILVLPVLWAPVRGDEGSRLRWIERSDDFARDARLPALLRVAEDAAPEALGRVESSLGLRPGSLEIRWILDLSSRASAGAPGQPFENGRTHVGARDVDIIVPARKFLWEPPRARPVIIHEAVHAVLASAVGTEKAYESIPRWLREGLALLLSEEGELLFSETLAYTAFQGKPAASFLKGVRARDVSYAEAYLAVRELRRKLGQDGLRAFVKDLAAGDSVERILEGRLGLRMEVFEAEVLARGRERVKELLSEETEQEFREAVDARAKGEKARSQKLLWSLHGKTPAGPITSTLRYLVASGLLDGDGSVHASAMASPILESLLASPSTLWRPEALVLLGECRQREWDKSGARKAFEQVLEVFGEDAVPAQEARRKLEALR